MNDVYKYIIHTIISVVIVLIGMIIIKYNQPSELVKIDLMAITTHYSELMSKDVISGSNNENVKKISDAIKANLEPIITDYAKSHNVIVIQSQALVDGKVIDITDYVIKQLDKKIK